MTIVEIHEEFLAQSGVARTPGLHVTDVIDAVLRAVAHKQTYADDGTDKQAMFEMGFIWERVLSRGFRDRHGDRPGELLQDGIIMSPDGMSYVEFNWHEGAWNISYDGANKQWILDEYKVTRAADRGTIDDKVRWHMQAKAYCYGLRVNTTVFRVLYVNGDYRENRMPCVRIYRVDYTTKEIEDNWRLLSSYARKMTGNSSQPQDRGTKPQDRSTNS